MTAGYSPEQSLISAMSRRLADQDFADPGQPTGEDHAAHVVGKVCVRCGAAIEAEQPARRRGEQGWAHDVCPPRED